MPIKSQAQRPKFVELLVTGKISNEVYDIHAQDQEAAEPLAFN